MRAKGFLILVLGLAGLTFADAPAQAFCGFYVAKADTKLFNEASKVVMARHDGKTVITMVNDYQGAPEEFAMVIPVPTLLEREQIHVGDPVTVEHLDAYTAPRLVEYFDEDPCRPRLFEALSSGGLQRNFDAEATVPAAALGVTIEARYQVGEYDILILSAEESAGLEAWLIQSGYRIPEGAGAILRRYLDKGMRFFVARVNLAEQSALGFANLRPLQIAFESPDFMLPIRLGMINARGPQELFVLALTRGGRVEVANYRNVKMPSNLDLPIFVKEEFGDFYNALFDREVEKADRRAVFLEYAWDMAWCDPCAADPLSVAELRDLGVFWLDEGGKPGGPKALARDVFVTRLHLRYDAEHFPEDLRFRETDDRANFQGRYILRHPWTGPARCQMARTYFNGLPARYEREAQTLASLTAWPIGEIRDKMAKNGQSPQVPGDARDPYPKWWQRLWPKG